MDFFLQKHFHLQLLHKQVIITCAICGAQVINSTFFLDVKSAIGCWASLGKL